MKAVCLLICLSLACGISGSIFGRHQQQNNGPIIDYREYIDRYQPYQERHNHHQRHNYKPYHRQSESSSGESKSQENQDKTWTDTKSPDSKNWNSREFVASQLQDEVKPAYGDVIEWNGVQMAVGPYSVIQDQADIEKIFADAQQTMRHVSEEDKAKFHQNLQAYIQKEKEEWYDNATQLLQKNQYPVEEHTVKTDDGYYLTMFRIPPAEKEQRQQAEEEEEEEQQQQTMRDGQPKPVVFLMHGLLGSADDWLLMGPKKSLAYLLADAGYDVWLGNARGNKYSLRHASKHPALDDFWKFSNDEIALHDLPAMIDYALQTSDQQKLFYVGYDQGTTAFFALTAAKPEYNDRIIMMYALSPMVYMRNVRSPLFRMIAPSSQFYERLYQQLGHGKFQPSAELIRTVGGDMCQQEIGCPNVCSNANFVMSGINVANVDTELIPVIMSHLPAGTSTRTIKHYGQVVASPELRKYDYGSEVNQKVYGQQEPPRYEIKEVSAPVTLYYSEEDWLAHPKDVEMLEKELPNVKEAYKVPEDNFSHMDYQFSMKAPKLVYKHLINSMQQYAP